MTHTPILLRDGSRCYSGPSCRRHGVEFQRSLREQQILDLLDRELPERPQVLDEPVTPAKPTPVVTFATEHDYKKALLEVLHEIDEETCDYYTAGACYLLARDLHEATGYPIVVAGRDDKEAWAHMGVRAPDGRVWDVYGVIDDARDFASNWETEPHIGTGRALAWEIGLDEWEQLTPNMDREPYPGYPTAPIVDVLKRAMSLPTPDREPCSPA